ncbi:MAG: acyltransferase [Hymenobacter sp.]|nr:MAG: acyltransferase [Hymenobacter sp.]
MQQTKQKFVNNFDFLRLFLASLVLITHSYPLAGYPEEDTLFHFSHGEALFSHIGVRCFFVISGYLITTSLFRSKNLLEYFFKRIIRVFPALWAVILLTIIGGYLLSSKTPQAYFTDVSVPRYFLTALLRIQPYISDLFAQNPLHYANGSLWTVPYEFLWYIILSTFFFLRKNTRYCLYVLTVLFLSLLVTRLLRPSFNNIDFLGLSLGNITFLGLFFVSGAILSLLNLPSAKARVIIVIILSIALILILHYSRFYYLGHIFILPPLVVAFGSLNFPLLSWIHKYGDISYGIYIWGFPVQQVIVNFFHPTPTILLLSSVPITYFLGFISWHLIEKKALQLKYNTSLR